MPRFKAEALVVRQVLQARGFVEAVDGDPAAAADEEGIHFQFRSQRFKPSEYRLAAAHQRLNHFPKTAIITRKDSLLRCLRKMRAVHGAVYSFAPTSFVLPNEYTKFVKTFSKRQGLWILKPVDLSRGRKIQVIRGLDQLRYDQASIIQRYVANPLCVGGYKCDLRLYVLVTSFRPLRAYLYSDGLVRFGTHKYDANAEDLDNVYAHLTNSSINKYSDALQADKDVIGAGAKWDLGQLRYYLHSNGHAWGPLWQRIRNIIVLTLLPLAPVVPPSQSCFELFGFDVIVDDAMRPSLLEVNCSPALGKDCPTDERVKTPLINDMLDVLDFEASGGRAPFYVPAAAASPAPARRRGQAAPAVAPPPPPPDCEGLEQLCQSLSSAADDQQLGNFELIFPFSDSSRDEAARLSAAAGPGNAGAPLAVQESMRAIVAEVRAADREAVAAASAGAGAPIRRASIPRAVAAAGSAMAACRAARDVCG